MLRKNRLILLVSVLCIYALSSCEDNVGIAPETVPGLFITWDLIRVDTDCSQSGFNSNGIQEGNSLSLQQNFAFTYARSGEETITGEFKVDQNTITFIPPIFSRSISATYNYSFSGRNFTIETTELIPNVSGAVESCEVKRRFSF